MVTFRASGNFENKARLLGKGSVSGKTELFGSMGAIPIEFENIFGLVEIGGLVAHADGSVSIVKEFGTGKTERIGCFLDERGNG